MLYIFKNLILLNLLFFITGCGYTLPTPQERLQTAQAIAKQQHLHQKIYKTKKFDIFAYSTDLSQCKERNLHVYIEGDGLAWITSSSVSDNPTPLNPLALKLMTADTAACKLYLARPCHYIQNAQCTQKIWTSERFAPEVIESYNEILNKLSYKSLTLFGYSGGGAVAALVAAQREDVDTLVTIAGNLEIEFWAKKHYLTPLSGSLNPSDYAERLQHIKQIHLIGGKDHIMPKSVFDAYKSHFQNRKNIHFILYPNFTHSCCWARDWKQILKTLQNKFR